MQKTALNVGLPVLGLLIGGYFLYTYMEIRTLQVRGFEVPAKVTYVAKNIGGQKGSSINPTYHIEYTFPHDGRTVESGRILLPNSAGRQLRRRREADPNAPIDIYYLPDRPSRTRPSIVVEGARPPVLQFLLALGLILAPVMNRFMFRKP
ncbi:MAG: hypothetical protein QNJ44_06970 [Rhodobacter sp.]|nr:hypothetical protein [Rhodobacter sp.]